MKNNAKFYRQIIAVIGIALLVEGPRTSRADDGRDFAVKCKFTKFDVPGANAGTEAHGINPQGDIVGTYFVSVPNNLLVRGFLWSKGSFTTIDVVSLPGAVAGSTNAFGINSRRDIVGFYSDPLFNSHGFLLSKGSFTKIDRSFPQGINSQGDIVGFPGFLLSKGKFTNIDFPGAAGSTGANGINPQGDIVGNYSDSSGNGHGFLLSHGRFTTIDVPGAGGGLGTVPTYAVGQADAERLQSEIATHGGRCDLLR